MFHSSGSANIKGKLVSAYTVKETQPRADAGRHPSSLAVIQEPDQGIPSRGNASIESEGGIRKEPLQTISVSLKGIFGMQAWQCALANRKRKHGAQK